MNFPKKYQILSIFSILFLTSTVVFAQSIGQGNPDRELREAAEEAAAMWQDKLALTSKQTDLMERKIIEFAIKKNRLIQSKMREEAKTERLRRLQELENKDMRNILTKPQYDLYIQLQKERIRNQGGKK
ncbi:hypothetical protein [Salinimicrobium soli]|uniref:hypothetical protein n=1 Tax=Salinimicrobium soli TaxID=1254399 RepID=UPI003AAF3337